MEAYLGKALSLVTLDAVVVWIIPALICFSVCYLRCRSGKMRLRSCLALSMLIFYLGFVASITLLSRQAAPFARMELELFWSYRLISAGDKGMFFEVFWNVVLFMPFGFLASIHSRSKAKWTVFLSGSLLSVAPSSAVWTVRPAVPVFGAGCHVPRHLAPAAFGRSRWCCSIAGLPNYVPL